MPPPITPPQRRGLDLYSLHWRLPVVFSGLVVLVLLAFLWASYTEMKNVQVLAATNHAQLAADQLAGLLTQSAVQRRREAQNLVALPPIQDCLQKNLADACLVAQRQLSALPGSNDRLVEGWTSAGERVLSVGSADAAQRLGSESAPTMLTAAAGTLRVRGDFLFTETVIQLPALAPVAESVAPGASSPVIVVRRALVALTTRNLLNRLIGEGAVMKLGNSAGDVWTDFERSVAGPAIDLTRNGAARYVDAAGTVFVGALMAVPETPYVIWVELPEAVVLAPASAFLQRMLLMAGVVLVVSSLAGRFLSSRMTKPLVELTELSEAVAAGDYSRRVTTTRRDEIGRLAHSLNVMADGVEVAHRELESRVEQRTAALAAVNQELEAFSYSVSHDLRAPLRHVAGFAGLLSDSAGPRLDEQNRRYVKTIVDAATRMGALIDALLSFSRTSRTVLTRRRVNLRGTVDEVVQELGTTAGERDVVWAVDGLPDVDADPVMLRVVLVNLLSNALKYTRSCAQARIEVGTVPSAGAEPTVFVRDNGVGFDPQYAHKLFDVFQRLHSSDEFEGTGIGLATVRRIVERHGGRVWAEGAVGHGATFYFSLPQVG